MMSRLKFFAAALFLIGGVTAVVLILRSPYALVAQPKGLIAKSELHLIVTNLCLMLSILVPTGIALLLAAWKYRSNSTKTTYRPEKTVGLVGQIVVWAIPSSVIAIMIAITWNATHTLDPYKPLKSDLQPLTIQVVALDWKWLFLYPEQGIATVNFVQFPAQTPIRFELSADNSPMNSFWIPQLSGQIYTMTGMVTPLHIIADEPGEYSGKAAEINGEGYADMTFVAKACSPSDFEKWVDTVRQSPLTLNQATYEKLSQPSKNDRIQLYSRIDKNLFHEIVMNPIQGTIWQSSFLGN